jgi:hypothetical protein
MGVPAETMKRSAQKSKALSLVQSSKSYGSEAADKSGVLRESFDSWLSSVAPTLVQTPVAQTRQNSADPWRISLSSRDVTRVNRATVRESSDHRHWPPEVVLTFLAAEVIKRRS